MDFVFWKAADTVLAYGMAHIVNCIIGVGNAASPIRFDTLFSTFQIWDMAGILAVVPLDGIYLFCP